MVFNKCLDQNFIRIEIGDVAFNWPLRYRLDRE
jgi:hypothetical protein